MTPAYRLQGQRGIALPVMLIMMLVMLITSVYLLRSSNSATLAASNLAYDATLSRAVDLGLHAGYRWLEKHPNELLANNAAGGYRAMLKDGVTPRDAGFWNGAASITDGDGNTIHYVIHRLCDKEGNFDAAGTKCVTTSANGFDGKKREAEYGDSLAIDTPSYGRGPQMHYVITARLDGVRGGNVINQMVVRLGA